MTRRAGAAAHWAGCCIVAIACALLAARPCLTQPITPRYTLTAEQWREDLTAMMRALARRHPGLYRTTRPAAFDSATKTLDARIPSLARQEVILEMARIIALAGDGHTTIAPMRDPAIGFRALPIALYLFRDGLYVRRAHRIHADLAGARVHRIGGASVDEAFRRVRPYIAHDNEMGVRHLAPEFLAMAEVLHAVKLAPSSDSVLFELEVKGALREVWLRPVGPVDVTTGDADASWFRRAGWVEARDGAGGNEPLWVSRDAEHVLWWFTADPGSRAVYVQINQLRNGPSETFADFTGRLFATIDSLQPERLVLDLRLSRGGDAALFRPLVQGVLRRPNVNARGKLLVLVGRATWSAADLLVDELRKYGEVTVIGEPSASSGRYQAVSQVRLPNSLITVRIGSAYWHATPSETPSSWTVPDIGIVPTAAQFFQNEDPVLAAALSHVPGPSLAEQIRQAITSGDTAAARIRLEAFRSDSSNQFVDARLSLDSAAMHFLERREYDRAIAILELAVMEFPDVPRAYASLSAAYLAKARAQKPPTVAEGAEPEP